MVLAGYRIWFQWVIEYGFNGIWMRFHWGMGCGFNGFIKLRGFNPVSLVSLGSFIESTVLTSHQLLLMDIKNTFHPMLEGHLPRIMASW